MKKDSQRKIYGWKCTDCKKCHQGKVVLRNVYNVDAFAWQTVSHADIFARQKKSVHVYGVQTNENLECVRKRDNNITKSSEN